MRQVLLLCCSCLYLMSLTAVAAERRPNVVILLADDLGSKDIGCYGGPVKTPILDELAAKGVRFTEFHAGAAICSPSRATLITGRQHVRTGIYGVLQDQRVPSEKMTVPASRTPLPDDIDSLDELESVIAEIARQEDERAKATVRELLDEQLTLTRDESTAGLTVETIEPGRFTGQVIRDGERIVYASLPATKSGSPPTSGRRPSRL